MLADPDNALYMPPLQTDHVTIINEDHAISIVRQMYNVENGQVVYVGHGLHREPAWLIIVKVPDMAPMRVGPSCSPAVATCHQVWAVNNYVVAFLSDQTGAVLPGGFTTMKEVPAPSLVPSSSVTPTPIPSPAVGFTRFPGHDFWFDYPSDWAVLSGFEIVGPDGPTVGGAAGIGEFNNGCREIPNGEKCEEPTRTVPAHGVVLDYRTAPNIGGGPIVSKTRGRLGQRRRSSSARDPIR